MAIRTRTKIREWGNSFGVLIPKKLINQERFQANDEVTIQIEKKQSLKDFFGKGKGKIKDIQKEKDEARKLWKKK